MEVLRDIEIVISAEEALASKLALTVAPIAANIPAWIAPISVIADVIRNIRNNKLCLGGAIV